MRLPGTTYNEVVSGQEHALYGACDVDGSLALWCDSGRVGEVDGSTGSLHDLFDVRAATPDDKQVMLGRDL